LQALFRVLEFSRANDFDETPFDHVGEVMQRQFFNVIASASEAIHQEASQRVDCFVACAPRNDGDCA
jgi:hypothetical protein